MVARRGCHHPRCPNAMSRTPAALRRRPGASAAFRRALAIMRASPLPTPARA